MKLSLAIVALLGVNAIKISKDSNDKWPSVARCKVGVISTDETACDQAAPPNHGHHLDGVVGRTPTGPGTENLLPTAAFVQWPSVARCRVADGTTDETACDDAGPPEHAKFHDDVVGRSPMGPTSANLLPTAAAFLDISAEEAADIVSQWPSVARCDEDGIPSDQWACDHANKFRLHNHDGTLGKDMTAAFVMTGAEFRPEIKCRDPVHGFPISCDWDDTMEAP